LYVGKASGADGIWRRWCAYAANGHGGNVALRQEFGIEASEERRHALRFAVLEIADLSATEADLCERESHWKSVLLSRNHGFNRN
ncbi:GIY-YIG nuclease family protein, partial [Streptococcus danieliae]|nr:GIY-YIG nuclease family protein [Streptococcus danieliae]